MLIRSPGRPSQRTDITRPFLLNVIRPMLTACHPSGSGGGGRTLPSVSRATRRTILHVPRSCAALDFLLLLSALLLVIWFLIVEHCWPSRCTRYPTPAPSTWRANSRL